MTNKDNRRSAENLLSSPAFYAWFRRTHYFTALPLAALLLFLVVSGIMSLQDKVRPTSNPPRITTTSCIIPESIPMQNRPIGDYLNTLFPGKLNVEMIDESEGHIHVSIESVWRYHDIMVSKTTREARVTIEEYPSSQALADIHAGKHADKWQLIIFQILGIALSFMVLSGIALAFLRKPAKRKILAMVLIFLGALIVGLLAMNR